MRLSARVDYALRAMIELAAADDPPVSRDSLSRAQEIPARFLESILRDLRQAGLVRSQRGALGGHRLARPAADITLADVVRAMQGELANIRGERPEVVTYQGAAAPLQQVWIALRASERAVLESVTLAHITAVDLPDVVTRLVSTAEAWE